jgi:hypothetical protein
VKIRSTEKPHSFTNELYGAVPIFGLQGLTLDSNNNFTAGIEAVEFEPNEKIDPKNLFSIIEWKAKWSLCNSVSVPLHVMTHETGSKFIEVFEVSFKKNLIQIQHWNKFTFNQFTNWWASIKGTIQTKPLYEASSRISFFDNLLAKHNLAWGGNIDGFLLDDPEMRPQAIFETRYTTKARLENYDPAVYFRYRGGDYKTWEPLILLGMKLKIPLFLLTFERKSMMDRLGFAVVDSISQQELFYRIGQPFNNIVQGVENIKQQIKEKLSESPPYLRSM